MRPPAHVPRGRDYLRMLAGGWLVILCATVLSAGAGEFGQMRAKPEYTASVRMFASVPGDSGVRAAYENGRGSVAPMLGYAQLAKSKLVAQRTIEDGKLDVTPAELIAQTAVTTLPEAALMDVHVTSDDADSAVQTVNLVAQNLIKVSNELQESDEGPAIELRIVDQATLAGAAGGSLLRTLGVGGGLGLLMSCLAVIAVALVRGRVLASGQVDHLVNDTVSNETSRKVA